MQPNKGHFYIMFYSRVSEYCKSIFYFTFIASGEKFRTLKANIITENSFAYDLWKEILNYLKLNSNCEYLHKKSLIEFFILTSRFQNVNFG